MRIGLFGGSFDPPHLGHLMVAEQIRVELNLNQIIWIPTAQNPLKENRPTSDRHRLAMLQLAISSNPDFELSTLELKRPLPSYTIDTLKYFSEKHPDPANELFFIMGSDSVNYFHKWKDFQIIPRLARVIVYQRLEEKPSRQSYPDFQYISTVQSNISSTLIRNNVKKKKSIKYLVPDEIQDYIYKNKLYS